MLARIRARTVDSTFFLAIEYTFARKPTARGCGLCKSTGEKSGVRGCMNLTRDEGRCSVVFQWAIASDESEEEEDWNCIWIQKSKLQDSGNVVRVSRIYCSHIQADWSDL